MTTTKEPDAPNVIFRMSVSPAFPAKLTMTTAVPPRGKNATP
jgi:hypothetical protein